MVTTSLTTRSRSLTSSSDQRLASRAQPGSRSSQQRSSRTSTGWKRDRRVSGPSPSAHRAARCLRPPPHTRTSPTPRRSPRTASVTSSTCICQAALGPGAADHLVERLGVATRRRQARGRRPRLVLQRRRLRGGRHQRPLERAGALSRAAAGCEGSRALAARSRGRARPRPGSVRDHGRFVRWLARRRWSR